MTIVLALHFRRRLFRRGRLAWAGGGGAGRAGARAGLEGVAPFIAGYFIADMIWLILAATGLAVVAKAFAGVFLAIKFAGAAYLLYLAWKMATAPVALSAAPPPVPRAVGARSLVRCR